MIFSHKEFDAHERIIFIRDSISDLTAIIAIHNTVLGPSFGGCRMYPYESEDMAIRDVLRLSRGMTYKAAICDLPYGGGKSVIIGHPDKDKTPARLHALARVVEDLQGAYIIADDVGVSLSDLSVIRAQTQYVAAKTHASQAPLAVTAYGVLQALEASIHTVLDRSDMEGLRIAVQGLGAVGMPLCDSLHARGAQLIVSDMDASLVEEAMKRFSARYVAPDAIYDVESDVFCPCALGGVINHETLPRLKTRIICGGANNQLEDMSYDRALFSRGIIYIPDYLAGSGGVIDFYQETRDDRPQSVLQSVSRIHTITRELLHNASTDGRTVLETANDSVQMRLQRAMGDKIQ